MIQFEAPKNKSLLNPVPLGQPLVFESQWSFNQKILIPKCEELAAKTSSFEESFDLEVGDAGTSARNNSEMPHTWPELAEFSSWALKNADAILNRWGFVYNRLSITKSWVNRHRQGGWTNVHHHRHSDIVAAAYIQAPPGSGDLIMTDPLENTWFGYPTKIQYNNYKLPALTNKVYFFAPFILHGTEPNSTNTDRWVLSLNIKTANFLKEN